MSNQRRTRALHGAGASALTPASVLPPTDGSATIAELVARMKAMTQERVHQNAILKGERRRHAEVETILTRHVAMLERQVEDLRGLYFNNLKIQTAAKEQ